MTLNELKTKATASELLLINAVESLVLNEHKPAGDYLFRVQKALREYAKNVGAAAGLGRPLEHDLPGREPRHMETLRLWFEGLPHVVEGVKLT